MRRPDPPADAAVVRELAELEAALAEDVGAVAAAPDPAFLATLEERVVAGFPRPAARRRPRRWSPAVALPAAAALLVAVLVAGSALRDRDGSEAPVPEAAVERSGGAGLADSGGGSAAPAPGRRVERSASVTLAPPADDVQRTADAVARAATALGGYVATSQVSTGGDGGSAALQLRVPSARLAALLHRLAALAPVAEQSQAATDITGASGVAAERVADARAERRALLRALGRAATDREIATLRERLRLNRSRLAAAKGALEALRRRVRLATVDVAVRAAPDEGGGAWTPRDALGDALRVLQVTGGVLVVAVAVLVPLALLLAPVAILARAQSRRRRERALAGV
jgi:Domain of unknown function (DUF4349)